MIAVFICSSSRSFQGLFNAVNGLGGGGQLDPTTSANSNVATYSTFAAVGFFAGYASSKIDI